MDEFWKWMADVKHERVYGWPAPKMGMGTDEIGVILYDGADNKVLFPTKQMLIGYMMEYLEEARGDWYHVEVLGCPYYTMSNTESRYNWLVSKINELA